MAIFFSQWINAQTTITSIAPAAAPIGATITITGKNFSTTPDQNAVFFGPVKAQVIQSISTSIIVQVPLGATHQIVTVTSNGSTAYSPLPFNVISGTTLSPASFSVKNDFTTSGIYPAGFTRCDFDGDGKPDVAVANYNSGDVSILKNKSSAGIVAFEPATRYAANTYPEGIAVGDLNGDGMPDLVVASIDDKIISVFINTSVPGSISFANRQLVPTGTMSGPRGILIFDIDKDGLSDLVVADNNKIIDWDNNTSYGTVSVHRNVSAGQTVSFAQPVIYKTVDYPRKISIGDLDNDGKPDIVIASQVSFGIYIFKNMSTPGNVQLETPQHYATGNDTEQSAIGDLDGDGRLDIVVTNLTSSNIAILKNTSSVGNISFAARQNLAGVSPIGIALGDIDGDGKIDMAVANFGSGKAAVWKNTSSAGNIIFAPAQQYTAGSGPAEISIGDVDGDVYPDLTLSVANDNVITVLKMPAVSPKIELGKDTTLCQGDSLRLVTGISGATYLWQTGETTPFIEVKSSGDYWVQVNVGGSNIRDTISVRFTPQPTISLGDDVVVCENEIKVLKLQNTGATYLWQDGSRNDSIVIKNAGTYWVTAEKGGCLAGDSINISFKAPPSLNLGRDTIFCKGDTLRLNAFHAQINSYSWNTSNNSAELVVSQPGTYWVKVSGDNGCSNRDTINIASRLLPTISWDGDTLLCSNNLLLQPNVKDGTPLWQDGTSAPSFNVTQPGVYTVQVSNTCGTITSKINISKGVCDLYMPNAFTPDNNGLNDVFRINYPQFIKTFKMQVFNRWGEVVYLTTNVKEGWNGTYKGKDQPIGNYVWIISIVDVNGHSKDFKGNVILIR